MIKDGIKKCIKCGEWKELSEFGKNKSKKDGLSSYCRSCVNTINANNRDKKNPNRHKRIKIENLIKDGKKCCPCCEEYKELSEFGKNKLKKDGLSSYCKICRRTIDANFLDKKKPNRKRVRSKYKSVYGNGKNIIYGKNKEEILVDEDDYNKLIKYIWYIDSVGYTRSDTCKKHTRMHRLVMNAKKGDVIDHINGNKLDNRKCNLRTCTHKENTRHKTKLSKRNKSGKTGVGYYKKTGKWVAQIRINNKLKHLGCFDKLEDAIEARKKAEEKYYGEFKPTI